MLLFLLETALIGTFISLDLFFFYIFFELTLIPLYFLIGIFGSCSRKIKAAYLLVMYTLVGSLTFLICIILLATSLGSTNFMVLKLITLPLC